MSSNITYSILVSSPMLEVLAGCVFEINMFRTNVRFYGHWVTEGALCVIGEITANILYKVHSLIPINDIPRQTYFTKVELMQ